MSHFRVKKYTVERHKLKGKVRLNAQFSFCGQGKLLVSNRPSSLQRYYLHAGAQNVICFEINPIEVFEDFSGTFLTLNGQENYVFKRKFMFV